MKKALLTASLLAVAVTTFAQGKVIFNNDSLHLVYFTTDLTYLLSPDAPLAGQPVPVGGFLPSGYQLLADLYAGTSANSLTLLTTTAFSPTTAGQWTSTSLVISPLFTPGSTAYFQVAIRSLPDGYLGSSVVFSGIVPSGIVPLTLTSIWPVGTYPLDQYLPGGRGAIMVSLIPEPSFVMLAALGVAATAASILHRRGSFCWS